MEENKAYDKAMSFYRDKKLDEAMKWFAKAIEATPKNPDIFHDRGVCLFHLERFEEALGDMDRSVELQPDYGYRYASRAYIRGAVKDLHGAIADYKKAVELDPEDAISYNNLGMLQEQIGYKQEAQDHYKLADELAKMLEDSNVESSGKSTSSFTRPKPENLQKRIEESKSENATGKAHLREMLNVFTKKESFKEFLRFVGRGFKA
jgi:tetratricopeptide (TPR) repeat protein